MQLFWHTQGQFREGRKTGKRMGEHFDGKKRRLGGGPRKQTKHFGEPWESLEGSGLDKVPDSSGGVIAL